MNVRAVSATIVVAVVLGISAWSAPAHAETEKVKTNQVTKLHRRPGEQAPVILTIKPGQLVTLLARDGRWLRIRVSGRTGWIARSKVDLPDDEEDFVRNTRRRP